MSDRDTTKDASPGGPRRSTLLPEYQRNWPAYFDAVKDQPPRETLVRALDTFERESPPDADAPGSPGRLALDIACGEGRDTREILSRLARHRRRWRVVAIDSSPEGLDRLGLSINPADRERLEVRALAMEDLPGSRRLPAAGTVHLVNASFALPFCRPEAFPSLWRWIETRLIPGVGRFAGQIFGERDEWRDVRPASHFSRAQVEGLLRGYDVEHLDEVEKEGSDAMGGVKRHHLFHIVARRRTLVSSDPQL